jgi:hypothetical protein
MAAVRIGWRPQKKPLSHFFSFYILGEDAIMFVNDLSWMSSRRKARVVRLIAALGGCGQIKMSDRDG